MIMFLDLFVCLIVCSFFSLQTCMKLSEYKDDVNHSKMNAESASVLSHILLQIKAPVLV